MLGSRALEHREFDKKPIFLDDSFAFRNAIFNENDALNG